MKANVDLYFSGVLERWKKEASLNPSSRVIILSPYITSDVVEKIMGLQETVWVNLGV